MSIWVHLLQTEEEFDSLLDFRRFYSVDEEIGNAIEQAHCVERHLDVLD